jgi:hypothetical protein
MCIVWNVYLIRHCLRVRHEVNEYKMIRETVLRVFVFV